MNEIKNALILNKILKRLTTRGVTMEEVKKEFIPLPDVEADPIGAENIRSGSELSDPLPSRMTRVYSEFLHRFDDSDPFERSSFGRPLFDGTDTDSSHGESENSSSFDLPVEVIPAAEDLEAAVELSGFDTYTDLNLQEKQYGNAVDENNDAERILDSGSFSLSDTD